MKKPIIALKGFHTEKQLKKVGKEMDIMFKMGYDTAVKQFLKDLTYIDTVTIPSSSPSNVFTRIQKIKDKWNKK